MPTRRHAALAPLLLLIVGCNNAEREELLGHLDDFDTERNGVSEILCRCPETLGYTTTGECLLNQGDLSDADKECIADAFDGREELGSDYYSCVAPLLGNYASCLDELACDTDWYVPCQGEYQTSVDNFCPELPSSLEDAILACAL